VAEDGAFRGHDEIADRCQIEPPAQGDPPDRRDDGLAEGKDLLEVTRDEAEVVIDLLVPDRLHLLEVHAGGKEVVAARQDDGAHRVVVLEGGEAVDQLALHLPRQGVHLVRPVERDDGIAVFPGDTDRFVVHGSLTLQAGRFGFEWLGRLCHRPHEVSGGR